MSRLVREVRLRVLRHARCSTCISRCGITSANACSRHTRSNPNSNPNRNLNRNRNRNRNRNPNPNSALTLTLTLNLSLIRWCSWPADNADHDNADPDDPNPNPNPTSTPTCTLKSTPTRTPPPDPNPNPNPNPNNTASDNLPCSQLKVGCTPVLIPNFAQAGCECIIGNALIAYSCRSSNSLGWD